VTPRGLRLSPALAVVAAWLLAPAAARAQAPTPGMRSGAEAPHDPTCSCPCAAAAPAAGPDVSDPVARLAEAKRLFQQGNDLRKLGDCARAVVLYERSRALHASVPNTMNAAYCLEQLGRTDEAYDAYEALITDFVAELSAEDKTAVTTAIDALRPKLALLRATANVDGMLLVDGRNRGKLPLSRDVRVRPGEHVVRVVKEGWATFEKPITVEAGEAVVIDAKLSPLAESGRLEIEDERLVGADVFVDGAFVGQLPWKGSLAPGPHHYSVRRGDIGSAPREATVVRGQVTLATVEAGPLAGDMRIVVEPRSAALTLNGVPVGAGQWRGRLPVGRHTIEAEEVGYISYTSRPTLDATHSGEMRIRLQIDENHPRWGKRQGTFWASALGGFAFADSLRSGAEAECGSGDVQCPGALRDSPKGMLVGVRGGYELPVGISIFATLGYTSLRTTLVREMQGDIPAKSGPGPITTRFTIADDIETRGPFFSVGAGYRLELLPWLFTSASAAFGTIFAETRDSLSVQATVGGVTRPVTIVNGGRPTTSAAPFLMPELSAGLQFGRYFGDIGFGLLWVLVPGPFHETDDNVVQQDTCNRANHGTVHCIDPTTKVVNVEVAYGNYVAYLPRFTVGVRF